MHFILLIVLLIPQLELVNCQIVEIPTYLDGLLWIMEFFNYFVDYVKQHRGVLINFGRVPEFLNTFMNQFWPKFFNTVVPNSLTSFVNVYKERYESDTRFYGQPLGYHGKIAPCTGINRIFAALPGATIAVYPDYLTANTLTKFFIFDKLGTNYLTLNYNSSRANFKKIKFDPHRTTYVLIHGWFDRYFPDSWIEKLKNFIVLKSKQKANVIIVDWSALSLNIYVNKVAANARLVGRQLYYFLRNLIRHSFNLHISKSPWVLDKFHLIGHSFGAQIAGIAGTMMFFDFYLRIGKLTALDPSDQCFYRTETNSRELDQIDPKSAMRVVVIHTNGELMGTYHKLGHVDIYVNGGGNQPGCVPYVNAPGNAMQWFYTFVCSHYAILGIIRQDYQVTYDDADCQPVAYRCHSYGDFAFGRCASCEECGCQLAGIAYQISERDEQPGLAYPKIPGPFKDNLSAWFHNPNWFVKMFEEPPYCMYTFRVQIIAEAAPTDADLEIVLYGTNNGQGYRTTMRLSTSSSALVSFPSRDGQQGPFKKARLTFTDSMALILGEPFKFLIFKVQIDYMSHLNPNVRLKYSSLLCTDYYNGTKIWEASYGIIPNATVIMDFDQNQCTLNRNQNNVEVAQWRSFVLTKPAGKDYFNPMYNCTGCLPDEDDGQCPDPGLLLP